MFSVPLGIMFGADVHFITHHTYHHELNIFFSSRLPTTSKSIVYLCHSTPRSPLIIFVTRSLIAAFLGNVVGAMFVAVPALYFYLWDGHLSRLGDAENGEIKSSNNSSSS